MGSQSRTQLSNWTTSHEKKKLGYRHTRGENMWRHRMSSPTSESESSPGARPSPSLLTDIKGKPGKPWVWAYYLTHKQGKDCNKKQPLFKPHNSDQTFTEATKAKATFSCETSSWRPQGPPEAKLTPSGSSEGMGPGLAAVASKRKGVSDRSHSVQTEIERNLSATSVSCSLCHPVRNSISYFFSKTFWQEFRRRNNTEMKPSIENCLTS